MDLSDEEKKRRRRIYEKAYRESEQARVVRKKWRQANKEKLNLQSKRWREENREKLEDLQKKYRSTSRYREMRKNYQQIERDYYYKKAYGDMWEFAKITNELNKENANAKEETNTDT